MSRGSFLPVWTRFSAVALLAASPVVYADDSQSATPPGYKTVYVDVGGGKKEPVLVKQQLDPLRNVTNPDDPRDPRRIYSSTNYMAGKTFISDNGTDWNKSAEMKDPYVTKVYNTTGPTSVYNLGNKATYATAAYAGDHAAAGYDKPFATTTADADQNEAAAAFAAIGSPDQNRTAPIEAKPVDTFAAPMAQKLYMTPQANGVHHNMGELGNGTVLSQLPDRPLTIDEVRNLINHGFKPDTSQPPPPASKPLNDPDYKPEPLRIEPTEPETPTPRNVKDDDDKDDPVPPPGTMADPPENSEPLPKQ